MSFCFFPRFCFLVAWTRIPARPLTKYQLHCFFYPPIFRSSNTSYPHPNPPCTMITILFQYSFFPTISPPLVLASPSTCPLYYYNYSSFLFSSSSIALQPWTLYSKANPSKTARLSSLPAKSLSSVSLVLAILFTDTSAYGIITYPFKLLSGLPTVIIR